MAMKWTEMMHYMHNGQVAIFIILLIYAALMDIKTRTIPDHIPLLIFMMGWVGMEPISSILGLVFVPLPYFIMALLKENSMGGGDIKLMGACGFYLGLQAGFVASILGLVFALIIHINYSMISGKKINTSIPLAPYLGAGCIVAHLMVR